MSHGWMRPLASLILVVGGLSAADGNAVTLAVPNVPDLTIETRETVDLPNATITTNTLYFKGAWQRREWHHKFPSVVSSEVRYSTITRCDERRTLQLNHQARLYGWSSLDSSGGTALWARWWWRRPSAPSSAGAEVTVTIDTVDTGERRQIGSYSARRVITTITTQPGPGANTPFSESVADGWYIDVPPVSCSASAGDSFLSAVSVGSGGVPDRVSVVHQGSGRRGFPIDETTRWRGDDQPPFTTRVTLVSFSEAVLENSLFDVPPGYRAALPRLFGGIDIAQRDTVANRLKASWQDVSLLVRGLIPF